MGEVRIISVVGARPNFMKMAPVLRALSQQAAFESFLVHTGQHYDQAMSEVFFQDLGIPKPTFNLNVGSASHAVQTAEIMRRFEEVCCRLQPSLVIVAGDVNSTLACSLTAVKLHVPVAHIESGLRSFDRSMPEEINRLMTDAISDLLFTTEASANCNLRREGIPEEKIHFVGNTMIDSLVHCSPLLHRSELRPPLTSLNNTAYFIATLHRPANVDDPSSLSAVIDTLTSVSQIAPLLFVTHPRTRERLHRLTPRQVLVDIADGVGEIQRGVIYLLPPLGYVEFLHLVSKSAAVLTDSGGVQEETTFLGIPCLTLRQGTERPVTVELGTNQIVGLDRHTILSCLDAIMAGHWRTASVPPLWDGRAAERVVDVLRDTYRLG
jgi:UDP-N-acetylglucosamine 2-epimerase (non-hydrolysing)